MSVANFDKNMEFVALFEGHSLLKLSRCTSTQVAFIQPFPEHSANWEKLVEDVNAAHKAFFGPNAGPSIRVLYAAPKQAEMTLVAMV